MTSSDNEKLVKQYFEHFNKHDFEKLASMYAETTEFKDPSLGQGIIMQTRQQTIEKYTELAKIFPDLHDQPAAKPCSLGAICRHTQKLILF